VQTPEDRFYNPAKINGWFAVSALLALAAGAAAILADHYDREWKGYQASFHGMEMDRARGALALESAPEASLPPGAMEIRNRLLFADGNPAERSDIGDAAFRVTLAALREDPDFAAGAALASAFYEREAASLRTVELAAEQARLEGEIQAAEDARFEAEQEQRALQALVDEHKFEMDHARGMGHEHEREEAEALWKETVQREAEAHARMDAAFALKAERTEALKTALAEVTLRESRSANLLENAGVAGARRKIDAAVAAGLRDAPLLDAIAPVTRIVQHVFPDLTVNYNFAQVPRVDRCVTCHSGIDKVKVDPETGAVIPLYTAENTPDPVFRTHSRPELFVSSLSNHSLDRVGCTVCHEGLGWGLSFQDAYHTPSTPEQEADWEEKHHWHRGESWSFPMLPLKYIEASCAKCHRDPATSPKADSFAKEIPSAPKWNEGQRLVERKGCFGCHKLDGYAVPGLDKWLDSEIHNPDAREAALAVSMRRRGPSLLRLASKWNSEASAFKWIWNPRSLRPTTDMPSFFGQPNNSGVDPMTGVDYDLRTQTEVWGMVAFLWDSSEKWSRPVPRIAGDAENGKALFGSAGAGVGCVACHSTKDFPHPAGGEPNLFGPELSTVGSKTGQDWLFLWVKDPEQYWHETTMPSLRLTVQEAADVAAYLASLRDREWEAETPPPVNEAMVRDLALEAAAVFARPGGDTPARMVEKADLRERLRMVGKRAITRYSCFGCHEIRGFERADRIGTQLGGNEGWGSKDVDRLDFGVMEDPRAVETYASWGARLLPHRKPEWAMLKLLNPRVYDAGLTKKPLEKLLMPDFHFTERQAEAVVTYLMSLQVDEISPKRRPVRGPEEIAAERMRWLARRYNCHGCHTLAQEKVVQPDMTRRTDPRGGDIRPWIYDAEGNPDRDNWPPTLGGESSLVKEAREREKAARKRLRERGGRPEEGEMAARRALDPIPVARNTEEFGEGYKVQPSWLFRFLRDPGDLNLRYWLKVRMPTFPLDEARLNAMVHGFAAADRVPFPFEVAQAGDLDEKGRAAARALFQKLECAKCHPTKGAKQEGPPPSAFAPDLTFAHDRLRYDWVLQWLEHPAAVQAGTKMPGFFVRDPDTDFLYPPTGEDKSFFGGDAGAQIRALSDYVFDLGRPKPPAK